MQNNLSTPSTDISAVLAQVVAGYITAPQKLEFSLIGHGNINDTYVITHETDTFILQKINPEVFPSPEKVTENSAKISTYIHQKAKDQRGFIFPEVLMTIDDKSFWKHSDGSVWRAQKMIKNGMVYEHVDKESQAFEIGQCLGIFHQQVDDFPAKSLDAVIPGFHHLPQYFMNYDNAVTASTRKHDDMLWFMEMVESSRADRNFFINALNRGDIALRVVHGDPKVANIIFDKESGKALTVIDLDTVGPGLLLHDLGDCLRSCCLTGNENSRNQKIYCNVDMVAAVLHGYRKSSVLTPFEKESVYDTLRLMTFELGLRFFTDYLAGDTYFKTAHPEENLQRARNQFNLATSIISQRDKIHKLVSEM